MYLLYNKFALYFFILIFSGFFIAFICVVILIAAKNRTIRIDKGEVLGKTLTLVHFCQREAWLNTPATSPIQLWSLTKTWSFLISDLHHSLMFQKDNLSDLW